MYVYELREDVRVFWVSRYVGVGGAVKSDLFSVVVVGYFLSINCFDLKFFFFEML